MKFEEMQYRHPDVEALKGQLADLTRRLEQAETYAQAKAAFLEEEKLSRSLSTMNNLAYVRHSIDTRDTFYDGEMKFLNQAGPELQEYGQQWTRAMLRSKFRPEFTAEYGELMFLNAEIEEKTFDPAIIGELQQENDLTQEYEKLLASAGEMANASENVASVFRNADMVYPDVVDEAGNAHQLTDATFVPMLMSPDRELRRRAFETYYKALGQYKNTVAATLDGQFKQLCFFANARHYDSTLQASLDATEVPVPVYLNLIEAVHGNLDKMYRYVALRKKVMGVDELHMYDVYTPIVADADKEITYEQAKETVLEALHVLGDDYVALLKEGFNNRWIDVYENVGKRGGAYSSGISRPHPYVLLNHKNNLDCQFTLAHEMGHALHSYHSCKYQPISTSDYVIFVAEVASTCNEVLLMRHLLSKTTDKKQRAYLINHFLDQFKGTVYRQTMFAEFELAMGKMAENGEALTADALCKKYHELNKLYFGPDMVSDDQIALEWARIPHFFYNYYVFQYATGFSAAVAIANRILKEGAPAVADYKKFLSGGCSTDPISLLKIAGVDMSSPEPVNSALALFGELVDELAELL